jgi:hypothetical protein
VLILGLATAALIGRVAISPSDTARSGSHTGTTTDNPAPVPLAPLIVAPGAGVPTARTSTGRSGAQGTRVPGRIALPGSLPKTSLTSLAPPPLPSAAINVATAYAVATYGWTAGETFDQWIAAVTPLVTAQWLNRLATAAPNTSSASTSVSVQVVIPAQGKVGQLSADVVVALEPGGGRALLVTLVPTAGGWAVDSAS